MLFVTMALSTYDVGDKISQEHLDMTFDICFGDDETVSFGEYENNSVIYINMSATW